jgi:hypothetical protein
MNRATDNLRAAQRRATPRDARRISLSCRVLLSRSVTYFGCGGECYVERYPEVSVD